MCCAITVVVFFDIFSGLTNLVPCNIIFALFCGFGLFITVLGDIFTATVPRWAEEILTSFKADIYKTTRHIYEMHKILFKNNRKLIKKVN